jgi:hypothetical protein
MWIGKPKPVPPPRSQSLEAFEKGEADGPSPHPSPSVDRLDLVRPVKTTERSEYANLGLQRSGLTPSKPQRTASIRETSQTVTSTPPPPPPPPPPPMSPISGDVTKVAYHPFTSGNNAFIFCLF